MNALMMEYKSTLKDTKELLKQTESRLQIAQNKGDVEEIKLLEDDKAVIRSWISNLNYTIQWIRTGRQPGTTRGIERRAAYDREIPVEPYWIQLNEDGKVPVFEFDESEEELERTMNKEGIVKEIMKTLDKTERTVFELASKEFSQREIARFLNMKHSTVQKIIERCKRKIIEEGWILV